MEHVTAKQLNELNKIKVAKANFAKEIAEALKKKFVKNCGGNATNYRVEVQFLDITNTDLNVYTCVTTDDIKLKWYGYFLARRNKFAWTDFDSLTAEEIADDVFVDYLEYFSEYLNASV